MTPEEKKALRKAKAKAHSAAKRKLAAKILTDIKKIEPAKTLAETKPLKSYWIDRNSGRLALFLTAIGLIIGYFSLPKEKFKQGDLKGSYIEIDSKSESSPLIKNSGAPYKAPADSVKRSNPPPVIHGILIEKYTDQHFRNSGSVSIRMGTSTKIYAAATFLQEAQILEPDSNCVINKPLFIGVKDNRLYISVEFKDLKNEENIGTIEYNHWKLWNDERLTYEDLPRKLEVRDKQHNIVMAVQYIDTGDPKQADLEISGYLVTPGGVLVMNSPMDLNRKPGIIPFGGYFHCFPKSDVNWKRNAEIEISKIKSIFDHPF